MQTLFKRAAFFIDQNLILLNQKGSVNHPMTKKKVAIIGAGSIGMTIANEFEEHLSKYYELIGIMKNTKDRIQELEETYHLKVTTDFFELLELEPDFIIEAANVDVVKQYGELILNRGIHFIPLSVGGLASTTFYKKLQETAEKNSAVLYIPSGAIGGFDLMRKLTLADSPKVKISTSKPPNSFNNSYLLTDKQDIVFEGIATDAIKKLPQNINVAIATALATVGPENVHTVVHSNPNLKANIHEITITNKKGIATISFKAQPSVNPSTSSITPWSVISLLKNIAAPVRFF